MTVDAQNAYRERVEQKFKPPFKPVKVSDVTLAFPAKVVGTLLPDWDDIPEDFQRYDYTPWHRLVGKWFALGLKDNEIPEVKEEFDAEEVWRHLGACMRSFEPKHEHKEAGVAYLMSLWCKPIKGGAE